MIKVKFTKLTELTQKLLRIKTSSYKLDNVSLVWFPASSDHKNKLIILGRSHNGHEFRE